MFPKTDFPFFQRHPEVVYFDNGATTQKPKFVINALVDFYENHNANIGRSSHFLANDSGRLFEESRDFVKGFLNASFREEVIFTKGTTDSINLVASALESFLGEGDEIILTEAEHHSNLIPWQVLANKKGLKLRFLEVDDLGEISLDDLKNTLNSKTRLVTLNHISNVTGNQNPILEITKIVNNFEIKNFELKSSPLILIDSAQSVSSNKIDLQSLKTDFLAFSGHKVFGPTGVGVLYGRREVLENLNAYQTGGGMVKTVEKESSVFADLPFRFEAGTPNIAGVIGLRAGLRYLEGRVFQSSSNPQINSQNSMSSDPLEGVKIPPNPPYEGGSRTLTILEKELKKFPNIKIFGNPDNRTNILSFAFENIHPFDLGELLNQEKICIRVGHHCAMPLVKKLDPRGVCRVSLTHYNNEKDVERFVSGLEKVLKILE